MFIILTFLREDRDLDLGRDHANPLRNYFIWQLLSALHTRKTGIQPNTIRITGLAPLSSNRICEAVAQLYKGHNATLDPSHFTSAWLKVGKTRSRLVPFQFVDQIRLLEALSSVYRTNRAVIKKKRTILKKIMLSKFFWVQILLQDRRKCRSKNV